MNFVNPFIIKHEKIDRNGASNDYMMEDSCDGKKLGLQNSTISQISNLKNNPFTIPQSRSFVKENRFNDVKKNTIDKLI